MILNWHEIFVFTQTNTTKTNQKEMNIKRKKSEFFFSFGKTQANISAFICIWVKSLHFSTNFRIFDALKFAFANYSEWKYVERQVQMQLYWHTMNQSLTPSYVSRLTTHQHFRLTLNKTLDIKWATKNKKKKMKKRKK